MAAAVAHPFPWLCHLPSVSRLQVPSLLLLDVGGFRLGSVAKNVARDIRACLSVAMCCTSAGCSPGSVIAEPRGARLSCYDDDKLSSKAAFPANVSTAGHDGSCVPTSSPTLGVVGLGPAGGCVLLSVSLSSPPAQGVAHTWPPSQLLPWCSSVSFLPQPKQTERDLLRTSCYAIIISVFSYH